MPIEKLNFVFVRHGQGCHNIIGSLARSKLIRYNDVMDLSNPDGKFPIIDPELTIEGVNMTIQNAKILKELLNAKGIKNFQFVISSPLIRAMETAYYTKREFETEDNPLQIYVSPYLREIDEESSNPKSKSSRKRIDTIPAYAMKPLNDQKNHLKSEGILEHYNFDYLDPTLRKEPGSIRDFLNWLDNSKLMEKNLDKSQKELNILVVTHAGVLYEDTDDHYPNNAGFIKTINKNGKVKDIILNKKKFKTIFDIRQLCPQGSQTKRCNKVCKVLIPSSQPPQVPSPLDTLPPTPKSLWKKYFF